MECPQCRGREFEMTVVVTGDVRCRFDGGRVHILGGPLSFDSEWSPDSACRCVRCHWEGKVQEVWDASPVRSLSPTH